MKFNLPEKEKEILKFWEENNIFKKTLEKDSPKGEFVFYDGPPFATGLPHYGHLVASLMKDVVPRFFTMNGYKVERKWGWDCHGLPVENIVEKEFNLNSKKDILGMGVEKFNKACREEVLRCADDWEKIIKSLGRFVDMENDYKTMDRDYMESVWWVFKELWEKGLIYKDYKSMHICPRCETTLSQSEVSQGYKEVKDLSVTVKFQLKDNPEVYLLAWTTTPWTLPGNTAIAVGPDIDYVKISFNKDSKQYILAKNRLDDFFKNKNYKILDEFKGKKLINQKYEPLFDYYLDKDLKNKANLYTIQSADFVNLEDGTGLVHIAPAFGEDDMNLGKEKKLPFIQHVTKTGRFKDEVKDFSGELVRPKINSQKTDKRVIEFLKDNNFLFKSEEYSHTYPHCWRCDTPLLNYATSSLFVDVKKIKDKLLKNAKDIYWVPGHIKKGRFGKWLEGAKDWAISRQRFWGSTIPVWRCDKCGQEKVFGSVKGLEKASGQKIKDLHKDYVDKVKFDCDKCEGVMKRDPDVLDCWFESGSMPYAQMHYPFENKKRFEENFPAEFIAEGVDQTTCWFYYLHVLATALKNKAAFKNVVVNGIVLNKKGEKMSKRLKNYPDAMELIKNIGADPIRYYLLSSPVMKANDLKFSKQELKNETGFIKTLMNVLRFYKMFKPENIKTTKSENILNQWIIQRTEELLKKVTNGLKNYNLNIIREIPSFINDLSTWYIRRSRDKIKSGDMACFSTMKQVLLTLSKVMAPFMPFSAEHLYKELNGKKESVHLESWPVFEEVDEKIKKQMALAREICEIGHNLRKRAGIKVRQALSSLVISNISLTKEYKSLIKAELNLKKVEIRDEIPEGKNWEIRQEGIRVALNKEITEELEKEGLAREVKRKINGLRKKAKLTPNDKVVVYYKASGKVKKTILEFKEMLEDQTKSNFVNKALDNEELIQNEYEIKGDKLTLTLYKKD